MFLDDLRKSVKPLLWVVAVGFVASLFFAYTRGTGEQARPLVEVNGEDISYVAFVRSYENAYERYMQNYGGKISPEVQAYLRQQVLSQMIGNELLYQEAKKAGLRVSQEEVDQQIGRFMLNFGSREAFMRFLDYRRVTYSSFEDDIRRQLLIAKIRRVLQRSIVVTDEEVRDYWAYANEEVDLSYLYLDPQKYATDIEVDVQQARQYYEENKDAFEVPEKVRIEYILVSPEEFADQVVVTEEEVQQYYADNLAQFTTEEERRASHILLQAPTEMEQEAREQGRARLAEIRDQLAQGTSFAELAQEYSEDPGSAEQGGDLGYFAYDVMTPSFSEATFALEEVGEVSDIVESPYGYHLIKLTGIKEGKTQPLEEVRSEIVAQLRQEKATAQAAEEIDSVYQRITDGDLTLEAYAQQHPARAQVTALFSRWGEPESIAFDPSFNETAFALEFGQVSEPLEVKEGWCIITLEDKQAAYIPSWEEAQARAEEEIRQKEAEQLAGKRAEQIAAQLQEGSGNLAAFADEWELETLDSLKREDTMQNLFGQDRKTFIQVAFALEPGQISDPILLSDGYYVITLAERGIPWDRFEAQKARFRESLVAKKQEQLLSEWLTRVQQQAKIIDHTAEFFSTSS